MTDILRNNLNNLSQQFYRQTAAPDASGLTLAERIESRRGLDPEVRHAGPPDPEDDLSRLLRSHVLDAIRDAREVELRAAFDQLLAYYSLVELACMIRFVPEPLPDEFRKEAMVVLEDPDVRRYYEQFYPLLLPRMLRLRLRGERDLHEQSSPMATSRYIEFLDVNALIERDPDVDTFLWFLDDGVRDGFSLSNMLRVLANPEEFVDRFCREEKERDSLDCSLHGFREFLIFCLEFDELLQRTKELPLLQSGFWHYHAYWFEYLGHKVGSELANAISQLSAWPVDPESEEISHGSQSSLAHMRNVVSRLTSGEYGVTLRRTIG